MISRALKRVAWVLASLLLSYAAAGATTAIAPSTSTTRGADPREPGRVVKIAVVQAGEQHSRKGNPGFEANFNRLAELARQAAKSRLDLIVFPEYAISGWPYPPGESINTLAEAIPGEGTWYKRYVDLAKTTQTPLLGWAVERSDGKLYNTSFLLDRRGKFVGKYRKVHANLGEQTWWGWSQGETFSPIELDGVRYGVSLCADMWFPETVRCLELGGADVVVHQSIGDDMGHLVPARAFDSGIPIVCAIFNGGSYAVDGQGQRLDKLSAELGAAQTFALRPFIVRRDLKYGGQWIPKLGGQNVRNLKAYEILTDAMRRPRWTDVFMDNDGRPQTEEQLRRRFDGRWDANDPGRAGPSKTLLGVEGTDFTLNGRPAFLLGISYYGALGASDDFIRRDLEDMRRYGFNWLRVWANWGGFDNDIAAVDGNGRPREPLLGKLKRLVAECDRRGLVVDVTLTRSAGWDKTEGARLPDLAAHRRAVETLVMELKRYRNWYLDLANERDVGDQRFVSFNELKELRGYARLLDAQRLVTASAGADISQQDLREYLLTVQVDFICPHRGRTARSPGQTEAKTREYLGWMKELGRAVPVHYQEPFRRGYGQWSAAAGDFLTDLRGALAGEAAGWCFHNGGQRDAADQRPRRSFDLRERRLFDQLDAEEFKVVAGARQCLAANPLHSAANPSSRPRSAPSLPGAFPRPVAE
ncbi:MAG: carbon-nitrogen hydrolase family protein [Planctomycetota bacterium]|nr:carbon-nitrogen hydrolase family protein [Planctomycetota bacterium]